MNIAPIKKTGLRDRKKVETRRLILKCANRLFHERGYSAATLEDIAERAGVHKQTVLRYFGSKEEIALAFRHVALKKFEAGLLDPDRKEQVLAYWRRFIEASAREVTERGDVLRFSRMVDSEPALVAASFGLHLQYEELLATEFSLEAGLDPRSDIDSRLLAAFLVAGNFSVARDLMNRGDLSNYLVSALYVIDLAVQKFPRPIPAKKNSERQYL